MTKKLDLDSFSKSAVLGPHQMLATTKLDSDAPWLKSSKLRRKRWQFVSVTSNEFLIGCGMVDASFAANVFFTVVDLKKNAAVFDGSFMALPGVTLQVNAHPTVGALARFNQGANEIILKDNSTSPETLKMQWTGALESNGQRIRFDFEFSTPNTSKSLFVGAKPVEKNFACTVKTAPLSATGTLTVNDHVHDIQKASAALDFTSGELPRETQWFWASIAQSEFALNLAQGNNLGGQNENSLWNNHELTLLPEVEFKFPKITSRDGSIDLTFESIAEHREQKNLLLVKSRFTQMFGYFSGKLLDRQLDRVPGIAEDQSVRW